MFFILHVMTLQSAPTEISNLLTASPMRAKSSPSPSALKRQTHYKPSIVIYDHILGVVGEFTYIVHTTAGSLFLYVELKKHIGKAATALVRLVVTRLLPHHSTL